ncbi:MAG: PEGA domain-containing protein [Candidatus Marinimicrobia bacterium]|nr:PEGA domain-containing protein [Candidatus Neomarinimicrobiota bacterium]
MAVRSALSVRLLVATYLIAVAPAHAAEPPSQPPPTQQGTVKSLAVLDFDAFGISAQESQVLASRLRTYLVQSGTFRLIERGQMMAILNEQDFQLSGCTSDECAVEVGQLLGAELMLAGTIGKIGQTYTIDVRIIDIETGSISSTASYDVRGTIDQVLTEGMSAVARMIAGGTVAAVQPPAPAPEPQPTTGLVDIVTSPKGAALTLDGAEQGVTPRTRLEVTGDAAHALSLRLQGHHPVDTSFTVAIGKRLRFKVLMRPITNWLTLDGPQAASVKIDGRSVGKLPLERLALPVGEHTFSAAKPEYFRYQGRFSISEAAGTDLSFQLQKKPKAPAFAMSLVLPGGGQSYLGQKRGLLYLAAAAGLGYLGYASHTAVTTHQNDYNTRLADYNQETDLTKMAGKRTLLEESFDAMHAASDQRDMMLGALGAVWAINIIDVAF